MTDIVVPRQVRYMPDAPLTTDPPAIFDEKAIALAGWYPNWVSDNNNQAADNNQNAIAAEERANAAKGFRNQAEGFADNAAGSVSAVNQTVAEILAVKGAIQAGPVASVMGRTGVVNGLVEQTIYLGPATNLDSVTTSGFYRLDGVFKLGGVDVGGGRLVVSGTGAAGPLLQIAAGGGGMVMRVGDVGAMGRWQRILVDGALAEKVYGSAINTPTFGPDLRNGSIHQYTLSVSTTINMPAPRQDGDQCTLLLYQPGSSSYAFSSNVRLPKGSSLPSISTGELQEIGMVALNNVWYTAIGPKFNL